MDAASRPAGDTNADVPGDAELLRQSYAGDQAAFRTLVERHSRYLTGVAMALCGNAADAEDLVQETFVAAIGSRFRGEASVRTWLVGLLVKRVAMWRRSSARRKARDASSAPAPGGAAPGIAAVEAKMDLSVLLTALSPEQREVIVLRELEGLSYEEIAKALNVPRGTVESRLHRAREALRSKFREFGEEMR